MKNSKLVKLFLVAMVVLGVILCTSIPVMAADSDFVELDINSAAGSSSNNTISNNTISNNTINNNTVTNNVTSGNTAVLSTNNVTTYNNTTLPATGLESSVPVVITAVVLVISAVYAYRKIQDYKDL